MKEKAELIHIIYWFPEAIGYCTILYAAIITQCYIKESVPIILVLVICDTLCWSF